MNWAGLQLQGRLSACTQRGRWDGASGGSARHVVTRVGSNPCFQQTGTGVSLALWGCPVPDLTRWEAAEERHGGTRHTKGTHWRARSVATAWLGSHSPRNLSRHLCRSPCYDCGGITPPATQGPGGTDHSWELGSSLHTSQARKPGF